MKSLWKSAFLTLTLCILSDYSAIAAIEPFVPFEVGASHGKGNLLGIQPDVRALDYSSKANFLLKMESYLIEASKKGWIIPKKTIVVYPEFVGTWLVAVDEAEALYSKSTLDQAMQGLVLRSPFSFLSAYFHASGTDKLKSALFKMKAAKMASIYFEVFSGLAKKYRVTIVPGSTILPGANIKAGNLLIDVSKELNSVSIIFKPDGTPYSNIVKKAFLVPTEQSFLTKGDSMDLPVFETPAGRLAVFICADSWYPESYEAVKQKQVDFIAVPSYLEKDLASEAPWHGYTAGKAPSDVNLADVGRLTEGQAWLKYALAGRARSTSVKYGLNVFLRGSLWELGSDGASVSFDRGAVQVAKTAQADANLVNLWF